MDALKVLDAIASLNVNTLVVDTLTEAEPQMVDAMQDQLSQGLRADGSNINPPYAPFTIREKEKKTGLASVTDVVTLFDTGAHYEGLFADVNDPDIIFGSKDSKSKKLQDRYGAIYGLNDESREELIEDYLEPRWQSKVSRQIGLEFSP